LCDYVKPYNGTSQPLSDWEQIKLAVDVANPGGEAPLGIGRPQGGAGSVPTTVAPE
jgi:hypothetical protein